MNTAAPTSRIVGFIHHLRDEGYSIGIREVMDMLSSLDSEVINEPVASRDVLRSMSCHSRNEWEKFDDLFNHYWLLQDAQTVTDDPGNSRPAGQRQAGLTGIGGSTDQLPEQMGGLTGLKGSGAGRQRTISRADFRFLNDRQAMQELEDMAEHLATQLQRRLRRRMMIQSTGSRIALRQIMRRNLPHGGLPIHMIYRNRRREPVHVVILHDVSHSMAWNNPLLFRFARGIVRAFKTSEAFAFHTRLFRVTELYREQSLQIMKERLEARNHLWMGGTCIAESIADFSRRFSAGTLTSKSILILISDGYDTGSPEQLAQALARVKKMTGKIFWLNPMLGREGYDPDKASIRAAEPFIDRHIPANNLDSLRQTMTYIARECR